MRLLVDGRPAVGGIARYTQELVRLLRAELASEQLVVYREADTAGPRGSQHGRARRVVGTVAGRVRRVAGDHLALPLFAQRAQADVVHCPGAILPRLGRIPTVTTCHDLSLIDRFDGYKRGPMKYYERRALLAALAGAAHVVTLSQTVADTLQRRFGIAAERVTAIAPPLPDFTDAGDARLPSGLEPGRFLLFVGVIEPRKNLRRLLEAHRSVWSDLRMPLVLIGPYGWRQRELLRAIAGSAGRVRWLGAVDEATLAAAYRSAAAVVQYSLDEGFDYPAAEALSLGAPLVLSDIPVHREVAETCALYAPADDPRVLAERLCEIGRWSAPDRAGHAQRAAARVAALRSRGAPHRYLAIYQQLCEPRTRRLRSGAVAPAGRY